VIGIETGENPKSQNPKSQKIPKDRKPKIPKGAPRARRRAGGAGFLPVLVTRVADRALSVY
jgi:hypothetical protein